MIDNHAAKTHLSKLAKAASGGAEIVIARAGKPMAKLVPLSAGPVVGDRVLGRMAGMGEVPADFDDPLTEEELARFEAG